MTTEALPRLYTLPEVAAQTGISLRTLQDGCQPARARFDHVRIGRAPQMTAEQVQQLIERYAKPSRTSDDLAAVRARVSRRASAPRPRRGAA